MLEVDEPKLSPASEELLRAVMDAIQKLSQTPGDENPAGLARIYAGRLIDRRPPPKNMEAPAFAKGGELVSLESTQKEIAKFRLAAKRLLTATLALHAPARGALGLKDTLRARPGFALEDKLKEMIERSEHPVVPELSKNAGRGRKKGSSEAALMREAARAFHLWTGKSPTIITRWDDGAAEGPFLDFVTAIFDIFQVKTRPLGQARALIKSMKEIGPDPKQ